MKKDSSFWRTGFDFEKKKKRIRELEEKMAKSDFWKEKEKAIELSKELANLKEEISGIEELKNSFKEVKNSPEKTEEKFESLERKIKEEERKIFLSGKYDKGNAILSIFAGAGGREAEDWATMLLRMYEMFCEKRRFKTKILSQSFGEGGGPKGRIGTKEVSLEILGHSAFGFLKRESGVHRLVRISPFSAKGLRHTSFARLEVLPEIPKEEAIKIKPEDLKLEVFRASGPGGQHVNKRETAVRITHLPTRLKAVCQSERSQALNREKAEKFLLAKLYQLEKEKRDKRLKKIKGEHISAGWGNQIRSYVLHPYKLVKDLRTGVETSSVEQVLDGELDKFIEAEIKTYDSI